MTLPDRTLCWVEGPPWDRSCKPAADASRALEILRGLVESETAPCSFDHHGHCQEHGWFGDQPGECGVREARQLLGLDPIGEADNA